MVASGAEFNFSVSFLAPREECEPEKVMHVVSYIMHDLKIAPKFKGMRSAFGVSGG